jgi:TPR repeat protein
VTAEQIANIYEEEPPEKARALLIPLAEGGNAVAQFYLGHLCDEESPRDQVAAVEWYRKSSANGYDEATFFLASFKYFGLGTPQDTDGALRIFRQLAEGGLDAAQWKLGQHLAASAETREEGLSWLRRAAEQGHPAAQKQLSEIENGKHV